MIDCAGSTHLYIYAVKGVDGVGVVPLLRFSVCSHITQRC